MWPKGLIGMLGRKHNPDYDSNQQKVTHYKNNEWSFEMSFTIAGGPNR